MTAIQPIQDDIEAEAALYFLPQGHYLFRWRDESGLTGSKFVTADDLAAAFANSERDTGWLAPGIVRAGYSRQGDWFVLVQPPHKETIRLLDVGTITIPIPMLVLAGAGRSYYLWAAKEEGAFSPSCLIFDAPFPNVHAGGQICWGNNTPPNASPRNAGQAWELFFRSPFNGHLANGKTRRHKDDVRKLLAGLDGKRNFPVGQLAAPRGTLESNINRLFR